ncbi:TonB-dependent receptor [Sandaracinomonas limnophila]|uniref:TonB-dependent receptor n=1 Tax=Sandaracinomonas limnophila TaxID=1862386 RepID=A0A437PR74_9BACT|nr:TonB-dependent receptor [Sandaracinomonas limnophila]RVU24763.1 TonB-dependent receptor [Sandaracinomonas limnophila]
MKFIKFYLLIGNLLFVFPIFSQTIKGSLKDEKGNPLVLPIMVRDSSENAPISEVFYPEDDGGFQFKVTEKYQKIILSINPQNFQKFVVSIPKPKIGEIYSFQIKLSPKDFELQEVVVQTIQKVKVKSDTIQYNAAGMLNGTERKLYELLEKIPGLQVAADGTMKYMNKNVQVMQLDGDDLFENNYRVATHTMDVSLIDKVQIIQNFNSNPILSRFQNSKAIGLNLVLKKSKMKHNLDATVGLGTGEKLFYKEEANLMSIKKGFKAYGNFGFNNSSDGSNVNYNAEDYEEFDTKGNFFQEGQSTLGFNMPSMKINKTGNLNYFLMFRPLKKWSSKFSLGYLDEDVFAEENNAQKSDIMGINYFDTSKRNLFEKAYEVTNSNLITFGNWGFLKVKGSLIISKDRYDGTQVLNNFQYLTQNSLRQENNQLASLDYSMELSKKLALKWKTDFSTIHFDKNWNYLDSSKNILSQNLIGTQKINYNGLTILGKIWQIKWETSVYQQVLNRRLETQVQLKDKLTTNSTDNLQQFSGVKTKIDFKNRWLETDGTIEILQGKISTQDLSKAINPAFLYIINSTIRPNDEHTISMGANNQLKFFSINEMINSPIFMSVRSALNYEKNLDPEKSTNWNISYDYKAPIQFITGTLGFSQSLKENTFQSKLIGSDNFIHTYLFRTPQQLKSSIVTMSLNFQIPYFQCNFFGDASRIRSESINFLNEGNQRNVLSFLDNYNLMVKSGFLLPFGFENKLNWNASNYFINGDQMSSINSYENKFRLYGIVKNILTISGDYIFIKPNAIEKNSLEIFNAEIKYQISEKNKTELIFKAQNVGNVNYFVQKSISDYAQSVSSTRLLGSMYLLSLHFTI